MRDEKFILKVFDTKKYYNLTSYEALLKVAEDEEMDVEDALKMIDENLKEEIKKELISEKKVLNIKLNNTLEDLY